MSIPARIGILTVSDRASRGEYVDEGGPAIRRYLAEVLTSPWEAIEQIVPDDVAAIVAAIREMAAAGCCLVVTTGGTGLTGRDVTPEALDKVKSKDIPGFGELFRWISYETIGTSTVQSRACAVLARGTYIFALPGSNGAVKDGWDRILAHQLDSRHRPCNFVELMPRLRER